MQTQMLVPAAVLVCWTIVVLFWTLITRMSGFKIAGIDINTVPRGARGQDLEGKVPDEIMWKSHNYTHLTEQPTIYYPAVIILALAGATMLDLALAWTYVVLRVVHSIWQATVNVVAVRGGLFALMTLCLAILAVRALLAALGA